MKGSALRRSLALGVALSACAAPPPRPDVVARLGGESILYLTFEEYLEESLAVPGAALDAAVLSGLFDRFVELELLTRLAAARGNAGAETAQVVAELIAGAAPTVGEREVLAYYQAHAEEFAPGARVDLRQILVAERGLAEQAVERLTHGEPFERVAQTLAPGGGAVQVWTQRSVVEGDLPRSLAAVIFGLPVGGVSPIIEADAGYTLFLVERRLPARQLPLAEAAPAIRERLQGELYAQAREALVGEARDRYDLQVFERNLPFVYRGRFRSPP